MIREIYFISNLSIFIKYLLNKETILTEMFGLNSHCKFIKTNCTVCILGRFLKTTKC